MDKAEMAKTMIQGMTVDQMLVTAFCAIGLFILVISTTITITLFLNKQQMSKINILFEPLKFVPTLLAELKVKVKSKSELEEMMENKIEHHALTCPLAQKPNKKRGGKK